MRHLRLALGAAVVAGLVGLQGTGPAAGQAVRTGPPYAPADALKTLVVADGFRVELVAAEPDVSSPVAMDIDERGRIFVVEMPGYPLDVRPTGRVRLLDDADGDGRIDRSRVFADGLVLPSGVMRWKKGVIVTSAPDVLYFEDADDDGRAERREVLLTGFAFSNPQHNVNTPFFGIDNWIYLAYEGASGAIIFPELFGDRGKPLTFPDRPDLPAVDPRSRAVRFRPWSHQVEVLAGRTQFGHALDAWGRYFGHDNSHHLRHEVIAARYLDRNPHLAIASAMHDIPEHGPEARVFPITENPQYELLTESGQFTSACGLTIYLGGAFPEGFEGNAFVAEPVHNLVHRDVIRPSGAGFVATRGEADREFLASTDAWFRPVSFHVGPEGALYVVDYYRAHIEHPEWTASAYQKDPSSFYQGQDRGRIYRVVPEGARDPRPPRLDAASDTELADLLGHANLWWRRHAQRLLLDRRAVGAAPAIERVAAGPSPVGRAHALWTLDGLGALTEATIVRALGDVHPGVRETAVRLAEPRLAASPALAAALVDLAGREASAAERDGGDGATRLRFQIVATLGFLDGDRARAASDRLLAAGIEDPWMPLAALTAGSDRAAAIAARALAPGSPVLSTDTPGRQEYLRRAMAVVSARGVPGEVGSAVSAVAERGASAWWGAAVLDGLARGARMSDKAAFATARERLVALAEGDAPDVRRAALGLLRLPAVGVGSGAEAAVARGVARARDQTADPQARADAIALMGLGGAEPHADLLRGLVGPTEPEVVQVAALEALRFLPGESLGDWALDRWPQLTPGARHAAADLLLARPERQKQLVAAMGDGRVRPWALDFWQKRALIMNRNVEIRESARRLLEESPERRAEILNRYAAAVEQGGDAARGEAVFRETCGLCHRLGGAGSTELGPDLATVRHRTPLSLLEDILVPSRSIAQGYETFVVERTDGRTEAGTLAAQTPTAITLRQSDGQVVVPRTAIRALTQVPDSSMPADLDKVIAPEAMADLIAYLRRSGR